MRRVLKDATEKNTAAYGGLNEGINSLARHVVSNIAVLPGWDRVFGSFE
jgi:hypothetical protein